MMDDTELLRHIEARDRAWGAMGGLGELRHMRPAARAAAEEMARQFRDARAAILAGLLERGGRFEVAGLLFIVNPDGDGFWVCDLDWLARSADHKRRRDFNLALRNLSRLNAARSAAGKGVRTRA